MLLIIWEPESQLERKTPHPVDKLAPAITDASQWPKPQPIAKKVTLKVSGNEFGAEVGGDLEAACSLSSKILRSPFQLTVMNSAHLCTTQ
jgi:hypothetical protein